MARYSVGFANVTPVAVAATTNYTDAGYPTFIQGANSTSRLVVGEIYIGGEEASASSVNRMIFARDSTVAATGISGNTLAALGGSTVAPGSLPVYGSTSTTKPQRSSTLSLLNLAFNAYGGLIRWVAAPGFEISIVGNTASLGEASLASASGTGKVSGHVLLEIE